MRRSIFGLALALAALATFSAFGQTPKQEARESTGVANSQKQIGAQKKDMQISKRILRHERQAHHHKLAHRAD